MLIEIIFAAVLLSGTDENAAPKGNFFGEPQELEFGRWRLIQDGLEGGAVISLQFVDQNTVLAGTNVGAFRSNDGGMTWTASRTGLPEQSGTVIVADPNDPLIYFAGGNRGVFRSGDGGATWIAANAGIEFEQIRSVAVDPSDSDHVYAAPADNRFFFTRDGGATWNSSTLPLSGSGGIFDIAVDPVDGDTVYVAIEAFGDGDQGIYKSIDGGMTFLPMNVGLGAPVPGFEAIVIDRNDRNRLFAGSCSGVFRSLNGAVTWTQVDGTCVQALALDPSDSQRIISGGTDGAVSLDGGDSWTPIAPFADTVVSVAIQPTTHTLFAGAEEAGIARSADDGATWEVFSSGLNAGIAADILALDRDRLFAAVNRIGVFGSTDGGGTWSLMGQRFDLEFGSFAAAPSDPDVIYLGTDAAGVIASFDGGMTWAFRNTGIETEAVKEIAVAPDDPNRAYAATATFESFLDGTVFITDDGGASWTRSGLNLSEVEVLAVAVNPLDPMQVFAGIRDPDGPMFQAVYVSNDAGQNWSLTDTSIDTGNGAGVSAIAINANTPTTLYAATIGPEGVFKSIDSGGTWTPLGGSGSDILDLAIHPVATSRLFSSEGLLSVDGGATWTAVEPNFPFHLRVSMNPADPSLLYNPGFFGAHIRDTDESRIDVPDPADIDFGDRFGAQVVVEGDTIIVGSPGNDDTGPDSGVVNVYRRSGPRVIFRQRISVPGSFTATNFGSALAVEGDQLVIGAPPAPGVTVKGNTLQAGIFERLAQGWSFKQALVPSAGMANDGFGSSVAIDRGMVIVGAPGDGEAGAGAGAAYVYDEQAVEVDKLMPPTGSDSAAFGTSVAVSGGKFAVGAPGGRVGQALAGSVSIFDLVSGNLQPMGEVTASEPADGDAFGASVALTGDMLAVGVPGEDGVVDDTGAVEVYGLSGSTVLPMGQVAPVVADAGSDFGRSLAFRTGRLLVGAPMGRSINGRPGAAFVFDAAASFALRDRIVPSDENSARFGFSVAVSETDIAIGAPFSDSEMGSALLIGGAEVIFTADFEN